MRLEKSTHAVMMTLPPTRTDNGHGVKVLVPLSVGGVVVVVCGKVMAPVGLGRCMGDRRGPSVRLTAMAVPVAVGVGGASTQLAVWQPWMVMGLGICMQSRGLRGSGLEGPRQDTALDWIPYPQGTEHWRETQGS